MRLIDADALSALLFKRMGECETLANDMPKHSYAECIYYGKTTALYETLLAIEREIPTIDYATKWISVKESLPKEGEMVLVSDQIEKISVFTFDKDSLYGKCWTDDYGKAINLGWVTHWMSIPKPPKEENE